MSLSQFHKDVLLVVLSLFNNLRVHIIGHLFVLFLHVADDRLLVGDFFKQRICMSLEFLVHGVSRLKLSVSSLYGPLMLIIDVNCFIIGPLKILKVTRFRSKFLTHRLFQLIQSLLEISNVCFSI